MQEQETIAWATQGRDTGTWSSQVYHTHRNCSQLENADSENIKRVPERDRERYRMRECASCVDEKLAEVLEPAD